jgi:hypothetical protein
MKEIYWVSTAERLSLSGRMRITNPERDRSFSVGLSENDVDPIQAWCEAHNCGRRTSFDTFRFKNKAQMTMFMLRWG